MFLPFLPLNLASLGLSLLVLPMLPDEAVIPLKPIETLILLLISSLLLGQWHSQLFLLCNSIELIRCCSFE